MRNDDPAALVRHLMRAADRAALATRHARRDGWPFASLVLAACDYDAAPLMLLSDLSEHAANIHKDPRVSLMFDGTAGHADPLAGPRATVLGRLVTTADRSLLGRYLARHPTARVYAGFADFRLYRLRIEAAHLVAGFGKIVWLPAARLLLPAGDRHAWAAAEGSLLQRLNGPHAGLVAAACGRDKGAKVVGVDPEGLDIAVRRRRDRIRFDRPLAGPRAVTAALKRMA